jgi:MerR family transcriptional regulator, copper efflux regulator
MTSNIRLPIAASLGSSTAQAGTGVGAAGSIPGLIPTESSVHAVDESGSAAPSVPASGPSLKSEGLMQIGDLAREAGKTVRAVHLYEELGLLRPTGRSKGRFRLYGPDAIVRVRWIGKLQDLGFSLSDMQTIVREWEELGSAPGAMVRMREAYRRKLEETREQIRKLAGLEHEMEASLRYLDTCEVCEPDRLLSACTHCDRHECGEEAPELVAGFHARPS